MKKLLLTGFEPFGGESVNPSWETVSRAAAEGFEVRKVCLPVTFDGAAQRIYEEIRSFDPDALVMVGQAGRPQGRDGGACRDQSGGCTHSGQCGRAAGGCAAGGERASCVFFYPAHARDGSRHNGAGDSCGAFVQRGDLCLQLRAVSRAASAQDRGTERAGSVHPCAV